MKKLISVILILVLALGLVAGCGGKGGDKNDGTANGGVVVGVSKNDVAFLDANGEAIYDFVRPDAEEMEEGKCGSYLFKQCKTILGNAGKNIVDKDVVYDVNAYEILLGATNRPESAQALQYLDAKTGGRYKDYIICTIGNKIVINAYNKDVLYEACEYFVTNFVKRDGVKGGIEYLFATPGKWQDFTINGTTIGRFTIVRPHFNSSYLTQIEMEKLVDDVYQKTGYLLEIVDDKYVEEGTYEIVVGNTNRKDVKKTTGYETYDITVKGTKVYLNGGSAHATSMAVSEFLKILNKGKTTDASSVQNADYNTALKGYDLAKTYSPVYFDNFDADTIDTTKWRLMSGSEFRKDGQNGKLSGMTDDPDYVFQSDGNFYIYGHEEPDIYLGGTITNNHTMRFKYGYVEHSVICPDGDGFWSLLWFDNRGDTDNVLFGAEIDLNECFGNGTATQANCHKWPTQYGTSLGYEHVSLDGATYGAAKKYYHPDGGNWADGYHTFGFLWDATQMTFTADGKIWFSYDITQTPEDVDAFVDAYLYMKLSFSVGRYNNNLLVNNLTEYEWQNTSKLVCDWIYLYQFNDGVQDLKFLK